MTISFSHLEEVLTRAIECGNEQIINEVLSIKEYVDYNAFKDKLPEFVLLLCGHFDLNSPKTLEKFLKFDKEKTAINPTEEKRRLSRWKEEFPLRSLFEHIPPITKSIPWFQTLLAYGADVNEPYYIDKDQNWNRNHTLLKQACYIDNIELIKLFLAAGATICFEQTDKFRFADLDSEIQDLLLNTQLQRIKRQMKRGI